MAVIQKTLFAENLDRYNTFVQDRNPNSTYFNVTELPDVLTGGKNAFLIAGSNELVPDTLIKIEIKDALGNIIYHEPGEGSLLTNINGEQFTTEYYEGVSKVVAVYVYPNTTAYGPCTITILGELSSYYDDNGLLTPIPFDWQGTYNVKWQKRINVNPTLANTTKIRFYRRPSAAITELISPIYRIDSNTGLKVNSGINQSFANIKISNLETFAGDVKRIKVFRTSLGDISDYDMIQDILVESKELLTTYGLSGSVVGNTGIFTSETLNQYWNTGSLSVGLTSSRVESGLKLNNSGILRYSASLDLKSTNTYELNLDAFYSSSTASNLGIYLSYLSGSTTYSSSIGTLVGITPTKNLLDTTIPFTIDRDYPSASLYFSQSQGEWHLGNVSLKLSEDTAFSPDEVSFITTMPTVVGDEDFNFKFEFYDVNNNYVPVSVTGSANFTGGSNTITKLLTFESDRTAFRFSSGSVGNPPSQFVKFKTLKTNYTGSVTYYSASFDKDGNYIEPSSYSGEYPGALSNISDSGALLSIAKFSGSVNSVIVGSITYTASCEGFEEYETIYRFEDGDNAPGVFVTSNTNQFIYKATDLSLNPTGQTITIEAKRKNLASATTALTVNSGSGKPPLTFVSTNATNGVDTYTLSGTDYPYTTGESTYYVSGSDQFGNEFSDAIKITPVKILDGLSLSLTNDNTTLPAYSTGFVASGSFVLSSGSISVKVGNETIQHSNGLSSNNRFDVISAIATDVQTGSLNYSTTDYYITRLDKDSGSLNLTVRYKDGAGDTTDISKLVTYTKAKAAVPNIEVAVSPSAQTIEANSKGSGSATPNTLTITALEGGTSRFTSIGTPTYTNSLAGNVSSNTIVFTSNASTISQDTATVTIPVNYTDSEGTSGTKNIIATISKAKKAAPTTLSFLSSETQTILSSSAGYAAPSTFTTNVTEGGSNYTYDAGLGSNSTYYVSSITGGSNSSGTITPTTPTTNSGTTVSITITYKNSEGTTGTITKTHKVAVSLEGVKGTDGNTGADGKRTATGMIHYQVTATTAPSTPSATSFTFSNGTFSGLTANWGTGAPTYASGNSNKYWYSTYTVVETTAGGGTGTPSFGTPTQAIGFSGLVSFTTANDISNGSDTLSFGVTGTTLINGSNISTGKIISTNYSAGSTYTTAGSIIDLDNGRIATKTFYVDSSGNAKFKGDLEAAGGTFGGQITVGGTNYNTTDFLNSNTTKTDVGLSNVSNLTPQNQAQSGLISGTTITGGGITVSGGGSIKGGQTDYNTGTGFFLGYSGGYKFSIGDASTKSITWDGSTLAIAGDVTIGGTAASTVKSGAASGASALQAGQAAGDVNNNTTNISGGKIRTGVIQSNNHSGTADGSDFSSAGMAIDLTGGGISAKKFRITANGDAYFKGDISGANGTFSGNLSGATISGGTISIGSNFSVDANGNVNATNANLTGVITATAGTIGGWTITGNGYLQNSTQKLKINPATPSIEIYDSSDAKRLDIHYGALTYLGASTVYIDPPALSLPTIYGMTGNFDSGYVYTGASSFYVGQAGTYQKQVSWSGNTNVGYMSNQTYGYFSIGRGVEIRDGSGNVVGNMYAPGASDGGGGGATYLSWPSYNGYASITFASTGTYYAYSYYYYYGSMGGGSYADIYGNYWDQATISLDMENNLVEVTDAGMQIAKNQNQYLKFPRDYGTTIVDGKGVANFTSNDENDYAIRCMNSVGAASDAMYLYGLDRALYISNGNLWMAAGGAYKPGGGTWSNSSSDRRVKQNEVELTGSLELINKLKPKTFEFKNQNRPEIEQGTQIGFIAQDVEEVRPQWVEIASHKSGSVDITAIDPTYYEDNKSGSIDIKTISFGTDMTAILVGAIKELTAKVEMLEAKLSGSI